MCELCDPDQRQQAIRRVNRIAEELRRLAVDYDGVASGLLKPHTKDVEIVGIRSRNLIRELVEEWV